MNQAERSIDINLPVQTTYNQWTQFEEFPRFIAGISRVEQGEQTDLQWVSDGGREWRASLRRLIPDKVMAWRCEEGDGFSATLVFQELGPERTRIHLRTDQSAAQSRRGGAADLTEKDLAASSLSLKKEALRRGLGGRKSSTAVSVMLRQLWTAFLLPSRTRSALRSRRFR